MPEEPAAATRRGPRTVRLDLDFGELEALAWSVWYSAPAARRDDQKPLESVHEKLLDKRRQFRTPGAIQQEPLPGTATGESA